MFRTTSGIRRVNTILSSDPTFPDPIFLDCSRHDVRNAPCKVIQRAMHIHPTVTELIPTMLGELKPAGVNELDENT